MNTAYLLLGSNLGNRLANIHLAIHKIKDKCGKVLHTSSIYETAPWGYMEQDNFLNQVIVLQTSLEATELMEQLLAIEIELGRIRSIKLGPRIIDIDILLIDNKVVNNATLTLPHPEIANRRFALIPLAEVDGKIVHPLLDKTITMLLEECTDSGDVQKFSEASI